MQYCDYNHLKWAFKKSWRKDNKTIVIFSGHKMMGKFCPFIFDLYNLNIWKMYLFFLYKCHFIISANKPSSSEYDTWEK